MKLNFSLRFLIAGVLSLWFLALAVINLPQVGLITAHAREYISYVAPRRAGGGHL
jgi:hypothetical protein